jgi:hypothetical protein
MNGSANLEQEIELAVSKEWEDKRKPILFSKLGGRLSHEAREMIKADRIGLKRFVDAHLSAQIRVLPLERYGGGVAPREDTAELSDAELEAAFEKDANAKTIPQYSFDVWSAFRRPLREDMKRYLRIVPSGLAKALDIPALEQPPAGAVEIHPSDLPASIFEGLLPSRQETHEAIVAWTKRVGFDETKLRHVPTLIFPGPTVRQIAPQSLPSTEPAPSATFVEGLGMLTRDELARIQIPADLVLSMLERVKRR